MKDRTSSQLFLVDKFHFIKFWEITVLLRFERWNVKFIILIQKPTLP